MAVFELGSKMSHRSQDYHFQVLIKYLVENLKSLNIRLINLVSIITQEKICGSLILVQMHFVELPV